MKWITLAFAVLLCGCLVETFPSTPGNAAIQLTGAIRAGDADAADLVCVRISGAPGFSVDDGATWGPLAGFYAARRENILKGRSAFGGDSEYTAAEEVDLEVDEAWTEIEFRGDDEVVVWRLNMVREDGEWKACSAELRG